MMKLSRLLTFGVAVVALTACGDPLDVQNANDPETGRVLATPSDVESMIRNSYTQATAPLLRSEAINFQMAAMAFENSAMAANFGMIERSAFPRAAIINTISDQFSVDYYEVWRELYTAIRSASDGLNSMNQEGFTIGTASADARARAFGYFVLGFAHANLAVTYDSASVIDETIRASEITPFVGYNAVMEASLDFFDKAIEVAVANSGISFPADWLGTEMNRDEFVQLANSMKARYRTQVARNPEERAAVDWNAAIAEVEAGITEDYAVVDDDDRFDFWMHDYMSFQGAWHQVNNFIAGMADTSGAYETWMATPVADRQAIVIVTPDRRFPQGTTQAAQIADTASKQLADPKKDRVRYYRAKKAGGEGGWVRPERGTWRFSNYVDERYLAYYRANNTGLPIPMMTVTEMDLIKAEGLIRTNRAAEALPLINKTRVGHGELPAATLAGAPGGNSCVPQLPTGACGDLMETLKWEKRIEQFMTMHGGWFLDSRGWGDLAEGTPIHYPIPARELEVRQLPGYTYGGVGQPGGAPKGNYGY